ncbi:MAG: hypothetical protein LBQ92_04010, partial [Propionibacteriaceae bacterium]|nr:hypothetical protein [Propionibacteriaceae bacterium]
DTSACQVYKGKGNEAANTNAAVKATAGRVLTYGGKPAWTEFTSSNGGYSNAGSQPYLVAKADRWDVLAKQYWAIPVKASTLESKYGIGAFKSITVLERDGKGQFGGRVLSIKITGAKKSVTLTGTKFKSDLGLRETMFQITAGLASGTGNYVRWQKLGGSRGDLGIPTADEVAVTSPVSGQSGLVAAFEKGTLFYTSDTGAKLLYGPVLQAYWAAGGPASDLGFPTSDVTTPTSALWAAFLTRQVAFERGLIGCKETVANIAEDCVVSFG